MREAGFGVLGFGLAGFFGGAVTVMVVVAGRGRYEPPPQVAAELTHQRGSVVVTTAGTVALTLHGPVAVNRAAAPDAAVAETVAVLPRTRLTADGVAVIWSGPVFGSTIIGATMALAFVVPCCRCRAKDALNMIQVAGPVAPGIQVRVARPFDTGIDGESPNARSLAQKLTLPSTTVLLRVAVKVTGTPA